MTDGRNGPVFPSFFRLFPRFFPHFFRDFQQKKAFFVHFDKKGGENLTGGAAAGGRG